MTSCAPPNPSGKASLGFGEPGIRLWGWRETWKAELESGTGAARLYQPPAAEEKLFTRSSRVCWKLVKFEWE